MPIDIVMPPLSQTSDTLVLTAWLKNVGDPVTKGEALFEVETDKAVLTVEAPASGTLQARLVEPGAEVAIKAVIGHIGTEPQAAAAPAPEQLGQANGQPPARAGRILASPRARGLAQQEGVPLSAIATATGPDGLIVERDIRAYLAQRPAEKAPAATPVARRMAAEAGLDLAQIKAATPGAVIKRADVAAALQPPSAPAPAIARRRVPLSPTRQTIARRLHAAHTDTVPVTLTRDTDATELVAVRERLLADTGPQLGMGVPAGAIRPTYTDFLMCIVARCLPRHPHLNAHFDGEALELFDAVHLGLAVDTERGLLVPVLRDVAGQGLTALAQARTALVQRTLTGAVAASDLTGGTFTLTNLGALGIDAFTPVLNPPQVAILGIGRIRPVALPINGALAARQAMMLSLTFDHRALDGAPAARFLGEVAAFIERPDRIWL